VRSDIRKGAGVYFICIVNNVSILVGKVNIVSCVGGDSLVGRHHEK